MKNKKGFTLVELLAVIVVLAIIMIIAVPAVLNSMTDARKGAFAVYGQKLISAAQSQVQADALKGAAQKTCYNISELIDGATGSYHGFVEVAVADGKTTYKVTLRDNNYMVKQAEASNLDKYKAGETGTTGTFTQTPTSGDNMTATLVYDYKDAYKDWFKGDNENGWTCVKAQQ